MTPENQTPSSTPSNNAPAATPEVPEPAVAPAPVQDPQVAPAPAQQSQYVITQESLNGMKGWLLFFTIIFALIGIGSVSIFSHQITSGVNSLSEVFSVIFTPLMAIAFIGTVILIALRKKVGQLAAYISLGLIALYSVTTTLVNMNDNDAVSVVTGAIVTVVIYGLWALYFKQSRRVHETLTK